MKVPKFTFGNLLVMGAASFTGYVANRFLSTMKYSQTLVNGQPEMGGAIISSALSGGAALATVATHGKKLKEFDHVKMAATLGSVAASIHLGTRVPLVANALPEGIRTALAGEDDTYEEMSGEEFENKVNQEVDLRIQQAVADGKIFTPNQLPPSAFEVSGDGMDGDDVYDIDGEDDYDDEIGGDDVYEIGADSVFGDDE